MQKGFVTLFSVILLTALSIALVSMMLAQSLLATKNSGDESSASKARVTAVSCAELALQNLRTSYSYVGSGSQALNGGTCGYIVTNTGGNNRNIIASSTVSGFVNKLNINTDASSPMMHISSWQEIE
jgi:hypothetical protein